MKQANPNEQVAQGNSWYVADQFAAQTGSAGRRRVITDRWRVFDAVTDAWFKEEPRPRPIRILDAGCGDGINLTGLAQGAIARSGTLSLTGVDYNHLRLGRARLAAGIGGVAQASLVALPFEDGAFDVVLCNHVIEHVPDVGVVLRELRRVLNDRGLLIVGTPNEGCLMGRVRNGVLQRSIARTTDHLQFFTATTLTEALQSAGFRVDQLLGETFFFPHSYVNRAIVEIPGGHGVMRICRRLFPSQAGGWIAICRKVKGREPGE